jgi:hypothetical protein
MLAWKYDSPHPDWPGPRSFVWKNGDGIAAHACMWPVIYDTVTGSVACSYLIDWAASRTSAGAGVALLRALARRCEVLLAVGGSYDTRSILPKLGYRHAGDLHFYARVFRPWRQFVTDPYPRGWKAPLRLARNAVRSLSPMPRTQSGWSTGAIAAFDDSMGALFKARRHAPFPATRRTPELMNYWLRCPGVVFSAARIVYEGAPRGWFVLSRVAGQARVADLWVDSARSADWTAAYALAVQAAQRDREACELVASASTALAREGAGQAGLRLHHVEPIFVLDRKGRLTGPPPLDVTFLESDLAYLENPDYPYLT